MKCDNAWDRLAKMIHEADESPQDVAAEVRDAVAQTEGRGFLVAPACVIPGPTPDANLQAARQAAAQAPVG